MGNNYEAHNAQIKLDPKTVKVIDVSQRKFWHGQLAKR